MLSSPWGAEYHLLQGGRCIPESGSEVKAEIRTVLCGGRCLTDRQMSPGGDQGLVPAPGGAESQQTSPCRGHQGFAKHFYSCPPTVSKMYPPQPWLPARLPLPSTPLPLCPLSPAPHFHCTQLPTAPSQTHHSSGDLSAAPGAAHRAEEEAKETAFPAMTQPLQGRYRGNNSLLLPCEFRWAGGSLLEGTDQRPGC